MKNGIKTTEFWFGFLLAAGIYALIWLQKYPAHADPGYEGIEWMLVIWGSYTGYRGVAKRSGAGKDHGPKDQGLKDQGTKGPAAIGQIAADQ